MLTRRVIVCLDVKGGRVVKGVNFVGLRDVGDPVSLSERYELEGADEITFLDISASAEERATLLEVARRTAERLFIPLTIGGGVRTADDVARALRAGADKVSLNSAAVTNPEVLTASADRFGAQCVVASIDAKKNADGVYKVWVKGGREETPLEAVAWAQECVARGAGEILLTSIDRDGAGQYRVPLAAGDQRAPQRHAAHERLRAVDGIEDPAALCITAYRLELLADQAVVRETPLDPRARLTFRFAVGDGDG